MITLIVLARAIAITFLLHVLRPDTTVTIPYRGEDSTFANPTYLPTAFTSDPNLPIHYGSVGLGDASMPQPPQLLLSEATDGPGEDYQKTEVMEGVYHVLGEEEEEKHLGDIEETVYEVPSLDNTSGARIEEDPEIAASEEKNTDLMYSTLQYK